MKMLSRTSTSALAIALLAAGTGGIATAHAQETGSTVAEEGVPEEGGAIVVTGSRREPRSVQDSVAPIDVISADQLTRTGDGDVGNLLRNAVPSFNVNTQGIQDAASIVRPANLRGLSADHTLVLVNGKRQHRAGVITFLGGGTSDGAQGPDISSLPSIGLKQIEVLRDGAASQYGSDAIAGVINFILSDEREGATLVAKYGSTYAGDGDALQIAGNIGLPVGDDGFLNLTAEFKQSDPTSRSVQRADAAALIAAGNTDVRVPVMIHGDPEIRNDLKAVVNFGIPLSDSMDFYAFGNYSRRETEGGFFFRNPTNRGGVYRGPLVNATTGAADANGVASIRVGDLSGATTGDCPAGIPLTAGGGLIPNAAILAQVRADPNCFAFVELFPGGFTPQFGGKLEDYSVAAGVKGEIGIGAGLNYDLSYRYGKNDVTYLLTNSINASLGPNTPTSFRPGGYANAQDLVNFDLSYGLPIAAFASPLNIAAGFEYRKEAFTITAGDPASYALGPLAAPSAAYPVGQGFSSSSNGFGGFTPAAAGTFSQTGKSFYLDLETDVVDALTLQAAVRHERYNTYGTATNYKAGALFKVTDSLRLRSTYSTGFRAPTAGQANVINVTTNISNGELIDTGTFPLNSPAGQIAADYISGPVASGGLGLVRPRLRPEKSKNFTFGAGLELGGVNVTLDYFNVKLKGRIATSSDVDFVSALRFLARRENVTLTATTPGGIIQQLANAGKLDRSDFTGFSDLTSFQFFNNDFDTTTQGVDFVATGPIDLGQSGRTAFVLAANYTKTEVTFASPTISATRIRQLEDGLPKVRGSLTLTHDQGPVSLLARGNYFGSFFEAHFDDGTLPIDVGSQITFDAEIGYQFNDRFKIIAGALNVFNSFPDDNPFATILGAKYPVTAPGGFNGGSWYVKAKIDF